MCKTTSLVYSKLSPPKLQGGPCDSDGARATGHCVSFPLSCVSVAWENLSQAVPKLQASGLFSLTRGGLDAIFCPKWKLPDSKFGALGSSIPKRHSELRGLGVPG